MNNSILVTGCSGFIGFHLSKILCSNGYNIVGIDNMNDYYDVSLKESRLKILEKNKLFRFYNYDIKDMSLCNNVFLENNFH